MEENVQSDFLYMYDMTTGVRFFLSHDVIALVEVDV